MAGISSFRDLVVWQEPHGLVLMMYKATDGFSKSEQFGLISQMRRAAISVPANIVEGFKRPGPKEKVRFYNIAEASSEELKYFLILSADLQYWVEAHELTSQTETVGGSSTDSLKAPISVAPLNPDSLVPNPNL